MPEEQAFDGEGEESGPGDGVDPADGGVAPADGSGMPPARSRWRLRRIALGFMIGATVGLVGAIVAIAYWNRDQLPVMTKAEFQAAKARWEQHGPASYNMDLEGHFDITGHVHVEVRDGAVTAMSLGGKPSPQRLWRFYSVPGLFGIIHDDLDRNDLAAQHPGDATKTTVYQQAEFDPQLGIPLRYRRTEQPVGRQGNWRITKFRAVK